MIVIHGDNTVLSREYLLKVKKSYLEVIEFTGKTLLFTDLIQALESLSLLQKTRLVVIESFLSRKKDAREIFDYLKKTNPKDLVIWEDKEISKRDLSLLPAAQVFSYKLPGLLFRFIDLVSVGNISQALKLYEELLSEVAPEVIWYMMVRQWRFMILTKKTDIEEPADFQRLQAWQKAKLTQSARAYTLDKLKAFYRQLLRINYREKSGVANLPMEKQLEMLLLFELRN